jgi:hypothetical protein
VTQQRRSLEGVQAPEDLVGSHTGASGGVCSVLRVKTKQKTRDHGGAGSSNNHMEW